MAARAPISAFFGLAAGALQLGIGVLLLVWAWVTYLKLEVHRGLADLMDEATACA